MTRAETTAILVTRGDTPVDPRLLESLTGFSGVICWDNSQQENLRVYGRYAAALAAPTPIVYTQDDDCIVPASSQQAILDAWKSGHYVANMPDGRRREYRDGIALVGYGACFAVELIEPTFAGWERDELFYRQCDRVFTALNPGILVDVPYENLPAATAEDRMWREPRHLHDTAHIRARIYQKRKDGHPLPRK